MAEDGTSPVQFVVSEVELWPSARSRSEVHWEAGSHCGRENARDGAENGSQGSATKKADL